MKRVVVTGIGIVSSIGNNKEEVLDSLMNCKSGINYYPEFEEAKMRSHIAGDINLNIKDYIDRKHLRFMADGASYCYISMKQAIEDAKLSEDLVSNERTGLIVGTGGGSPYWQEVYVIAMRSPRGVKSVSPFSVPKIMTSTTSACLAYPFKIKGLSYGITSACATSSHCIGNASELIQLGKQDIVFAGAGEEVTWHLAFCFDAMGALSTKYNDKPKLASRPFDVDRDGFVISGGGGVLVLEELEHALARGAKIYAELTGYGATSDGYSMVEPSGEGAIRCMNMAINTTNGKIDYINAHGTSTSLGDKKELYAISNVFKEKSPYITSTKSFSGHALGAAGVHEAIYSILMMNNNFIAPSLNIDKLDSDNPNLNIVTQIKKDVEINQVLSNSFGFGGTNASLVFAKYK